MNIRPYLLLTLLWAVYFHPLVLHPGGVLYADDSDYLAEHLPAKQFLNREWQATGELPRWNPYHFGGTPFVHDMQVGAFYPPHAVLYVVPELAVGPAGSWITALHVLLTGLLAYRYARAQHLGEVGSLVTAGGWMFAGKWLTHLLVAGHTILIGLAWLPLVVLGLERATRSGRIGPAVGAGLGFALMLLGTHPQWSFYAAAFAAVWTLGDTGFTRRGLGRWLRAGLVIGAVAVPLAAVQLLPTLEAAGQSARGPGIPMTGSSNLGPVTFFALIGPATADIPPLTWEVRGVFAVTWLAAALAAPAVAGGRCGWRAGVFLGLVFFAVGGAAAVDWLPGFRLFRIPGRVLVVAGFPLAVLAGATTDALLRGGWAAAGRREVRRKLGMVAAVGLLPAVTGGLLWRFGLDERTTWLPGAVGWAGAAAAVPLMWWLCGRRAVDAGTCGVLWLAVLAVDLLAPVALLPEVRPEAAIYPRTAALDYLASLPGPGAGRVLDQVVGKDHEQTAVFGIGAPLALVGRVEAVRGYNPVDVWHYRAYLGFAAAEEEPERGGPFAQQAVSRFGVAYPELLDRLNVTHLVWPAAVPPPPGGWVPVLVDPAPAAVPPLTPMSPRPLEPHVVYRNPRALPRAWTVPRAEPMPAGKELVYLRATDPRQVVLATGGDDGASEGHEPPGEATITEYTPNRVRVGIAPGGAGWLVLADTWFPGWVCRVDGVDVPVERANHAVRAVRLPAGAREAVFTFEPRSYRVGWWVSAGWLGLLAVVGGFRLARR